MTAEILENGGYGMANSVEPNQTAQGARSSLIRLYTVCSDLALSQNFVFSSPEPKAHR